MKILATLLTWLVAALYIPMFAYGGHWKAYTIVDGLAGGNIRAIIEDRKGNLWIATDGDGVSRYDGQEFRNFTTREGLANNFVWAVLEDRKGDLWFATRAGVCRYDGNGFEKPMDFNDGLVDNFVTSIVEDSKGNLWFGTMAGVSKYDGEAFENFTVEQGLGHNHVWSILEDRAGNLWFGTEEGGVSKYDGKQFETFTIEHGLGHNHVRAILEDRAGNLWFGTGGGGVSKYDGKQFDTFTTDNGLVDNHVKAILEDSTGNLWFGTRGGVSKYNGKDFQNFTSRDGLIGNSVNTIIEGREGNLWFGTWGHGICQYDDRIQTYFRTGAKIAQAIEDSHGNLWFATRGDGVFKYDGVTFENFTHKDGLTSDEVSTILEDRNGVLWFSGLGGITKYNKGEFQTIKDVGLAGTHAMPIFEDKAGVLWLNVWKSATTIKIGRYDSKNFHYFPVEDSLLPSGVGDKKALQDKKGNIWFVTAGNGIYRYNGTNFEHLTMVHGLAGNRVSSVIEDRAGNIWFGVRGNDKPQSIGFGGLSVYDGTRFKTYSTADGLGSDSVIGILKDRNGNLWFRTYHGGISKYDGEKFQTFRMKDGLASNTIRSMLEDNEGNIWFGSQSAGVSKYDGNSFQTLTIEDGLISNTAFVILADKRGDIWFRYNVPGLTKYTPSKNVLPHVEITQVEADKKHPEAGEVEIPFKTRVVFRYKGLSLKTQFDNIRYVYKLEGDSETWSASTRKREAEYNDLKPGTYIFKVKAIDRDLNYSDPPASLKLIVRVPFYMATSFVIPAVIVVIALISGFCIGASKFYEQRKIATQLKKDLQRQEELERQRITKELQDARDMQMRLMPQEPPKLDEFDIYGTCKPTNEVGGDFFDYIWQGQKKEKLAITLADVTGKGMKAAMTAVMADGMLHAEAKFWENSTGEFLSEFNKSLYERTEKRTFVAFCLASIDINAKTLHFSNAGLSWPLIKRGKKVITIAEASGLPLGIRAGEVYKETSLQLEEGDIAVFCTDGIIEAMNQNEEVYSFERLEEVIRNTLPGLSASQFVAEILKDVETFVGKADQYDDMTIVVLKVN